MDILLERDVGGGVTHGEDADQEPRNGDQRRTDPDDGAGSEAAGESAGGESGGCDAQVTGRLVQPERQAAAPGPGQVDLHHDGHRPGEPLVDAEQQVGADDVPPRGGKANEERDRQRHQPADHQQALTADPFREVAGGEVGKCLRSAERDDEGEDRRARA